VLQNYQTLVQSECNYSKISNENANANANADTTGIASAGRYFSLYSTSSQLWQYKK